MNHAKISQSKMQNIEAGIFCDSEALNVLTAATSNYQFEKHAQIHRKMRKRERERDGHNSFSIRCMKKEIDNDGSSAKSSLNAISKDSFTKPS